jgi:hypothetical protein
MLLWSMDKLASKQDGEESSWDCDCCLGVAIASPFVLMTEPDMLLTTANLNAVTVVVQSKIVTVSIVLISNLVDRLI